MTDTPPTLVEFLRSRLDEDARVAEAATSGPWTAETHLHRHTREPVSYEVHPVAEQEGNGCGGVLTASDAVHIARHDPARMLAEVDAKRQLLAGHAKAVETVRELGSLRERVKARRQDVLMVEMEQASVVHRRDVLCGVLGILALPYADHPDYREEWRP